MTRSEGMAGGSAPRTLLRQALAIATMDAQRRVLRQADILIEGSRISKVGKDLSGERHDNQVDLRGKVVLPGMINTHHHLYQSLTRVIPRVQDAKLFDWLRELYQVWRHLDAEAVRVGALVGLGELLLSGCTTSTDHHYVFPKSATPNLIDVQVQAARELGIRFHPCRGSMSRGQSRGGLPPDDLTQSEEAILEDCERVVEEFHDPAPFSLCRVALAPCSPFSVTDGLLERTAELARRHHVRLHTHLAETVDEEEFCLRTHGLRPLTYMQRVGWLGEDVWYAHGIHFSEEEIATLADTGTGVAHCPSSNLRLGSGIAPVLRMRATGVPVGLAVDGSASNDASNMLAETRQALLVHRSVGGADAMPLMGALELATLGGARLLGRDDIGSIEPGKAADIAIFQVQQIGYAGAMHDPVAALLFCAPAQRADLVYVNGQLVVAHGQLVGASEDELVARANRIAGNMLSQRGSVVGPA